MLFDAERLCPRCAGRHIEDEKHVLFECYWYYPLREQFRRLYRGTEGPTHGVGGHPACMQRLMTHPNQAKVAHLVHLIDKYHQMPLCDVMVDDSRMTCMDHHLPTVGHADGPPTFLFCFCELGLAFLPNEPAIGSPNGRRYPVHSV
jgi:hypothetical protein